LLRGSTDVEAREPDIGLRPAPADVERVRALLSEHRARWGAGPVVALCPGSTNSRAKRWPAARYAALADMLVLNAGAQVLLIGAAEEGDVAKEVTSLMRHKPVVLTGLTSLAETTALLSIADLLVTNDTGPSHVAAAVDCPSVVVFGPTDPTTTAPFSKLSQVVRRPPACAPCMLRDCPIDHRCMTAIAPEEVYESAMRVIAAAGARHKLAGAAR
jgi:heptosyltransferase-2